MQRWNQLHLLSLLTLFLILPKMFPVGLPWTLDEPTKDQRQEAKDPFLQAKHRNLNSKPNNLFIRFSSLLSEQTTNTPTSSDKDEKYLTKRPRRIRPSHINRPDMGEIVFFDVETTVPSGTGQRFWVLEFGAIVVCPRKLVEIESYCTLIRPNDLSAVGKKRFSGITREAVASAPMFEEVADKIFGILNGRVWAGHNIQRFDCHRIKEAFADIGRPAPEPVGVIDSLAVLGHGFGRRAGDLKMATLASYFGLGQQKHRSLDDVRMNLEVLKHCATVLLLESSLPHVLSNNRNLGNLSMVTRSRANGSSCGEEASRKSPPINLGTQRAVPYRKNRLGKVVERAREALQEARGTRPINSLLRHSRSLLR